MSIAEQIQGWVYGELSVEPSITLIEAVIRGYEALIWSTGPVPGDTLVIVKLNDNTTSVGRFVGQPGQWVTVFSSAMGKSVIAWRPLP